MSLSELQDSKLGNDHLPAKTVEYLPAPFSTLPGPASFLRERCYAI